MHKVAQAKVKTLNILTQHLLLKIITIRKLLRSGYHYAIVDKPTVVNRRHEERLTHSLAPPFGVA